MIKVHDIELKKIKLDSYPVSAQTLDLAMKIKLGTLNIEDLPPIRLMIDENGTYKIKDGRHRVLAFRMNEIKTIKSTVYKPAVKVKKNSRKKRSRNKIANAIALFEKVTGLEAIFINKVSKTYYYIKNEKNSSDYSVNLSTNKVERCYSDPD